MSRALHISGIAWALTSLLILGANCSAIWACLGGASLFLLLLLFGKKRLPLWIYSAVVAVFLCGMSLWIRADAFSLRASYAGTEQVVRGVVTDQVFLGDSCRMQLRLTSENPVGLQNAIVQLHANAGVDVWPGDVVEYALQLEASSLAQSGSKNIDFRAFGTNPRILGTMETLEVKLLRLRRTMASRIGSFLPKEEAAVVSGVLIGCGEQIPNTLRTTYAKAGISHLLAVSGMHLTVMLSIFSMLIQRSWLSRRQRVFLEIVLALSFTFLTGFSPSIMRAVTMYVICRAAFLFGRDADGLNSLGLALIILLIANPYSVFSVSLQLSYLSTLGICGLSQPICDWLSRVFCHCDSHTLYETAPKRMSILSIVSISLSAQIFTIPLVCYYFGILSLAGPFVNLLITLPASGLLLFGLLALLFSFSPLFLGAFRFFAFLSGLCVRLITWLATIFARIPGSSFVLQDDIIIVFITLCIAILLLLWYRRKFAYYALWTCSWGACALMALCFFRVIFWGYPVTMTVPEYGTSMLFSYRNQSVLLGIPKDSGEAENLIAMMNDYDITQIDLLITARASDLNTYAAQFLTRAYPPKKTVHLKESEMLEAQLFAGIQLHKTTDTQMLIDWNGLTIAKSFGNETSDAHIMIDKRNDISHNPQLTLVKNSRYYQCTRYFFRVPDSEREDA